MKKTNYIYITLITLLLVGSCKQEVIVPVDPPIVTPPTPSKGSADFTKFVAIGNSFVAGMQASSLYNESQANSLPRIMAKQFETVGGPTTFNQPDINSVNGFNPINSNTGIGLILGRLFLFDPDGTTGPRTPGPAAAKAPATSVTCPSSVSTPAAPAPFNTSDFPASFAVGSRAALNNFGVPLIYTAQTLTPATGFANPANPAWSPFYSRFASSPSTNGADGSTIVGDAKTAAGSFYLIWLGFDDVLLYAATGADGATAGTFPMTDLSAFNTYYGGAIATLMTGTTFKGVVGNIPNFTSLPYFYTVPWNTIALDAATATALTTGLSTGYNGFLTAMVGAGVITQAEADKRKLTFAAGKNGVLMVDETLTDLTAAMNANGAGALVPYARARQANATDLVPLAAGSILGTCNGSAAAIWGVSYPVADRYILTAAETGAILARTAEFNATISSLVTANTTRLALADVNKAYADLVTNKAYISDNVMITPSFAPPTGAYSEDGLHPNSRGYAFTANVFIDAINTKFTAVIPKASLAAYSGTALPVNP